MYVIHDETGNILHSINGPDANYGKTLTAAGQEWIYLEGLFEFNPVTQFVDVEKKSTINSEFENTPGKKQTDRPNYTDCLCPRTAPAIATDKITIAANGTDTARVINIPAGAGVTILSDAGIEFEGVVDDGEVELTAIDPTTYTVHIVAGARYLPASIQVVAQ